MAALRVSDSLTLDDRAISCTFVRSPGPGGQNVNKVATAVQLRCDTAPLPCGVRQRLAPLAGTRLGADGVLMISAHRFRTQEANRRDALQRLVQLLLLAATPPRPRRRTRRTHGSQERRLSAKKRHGERKRERLVQW